MRCPQCEDANCIQIAINLAVDETVQFYSCRRCEAKWWQKEGDPIALDEVLSLATERNGK